MKKQNPIWKNFKRLGYLLLLMLICKSAFSQQNEEAAFYIFKKDWSAAKDMKGATYFMQLVHENDSTYICRYYNKFGSMIRQESYLDSMLTIPNGRFCWYDQNGMLDSTGLVNRRMKTGTWKCYNDNGEPKASIIYSNGHIIAQSNYLKKEFTIENSNIFGNKADEKAVRNTLAVDSLNEAMQLKQVSFGEPDSSEKHWKDYLKENITVPERFISINENGSCIAVVSFTINKEGKPDDIYLTRSCEWSADNEVLNAVKNSPSWNITDRYKESIEYNIEQAVTFYSSTNRYTDSVIKDVYIGIAIPAKFPGGPQAWQHFLAKNLKSDVAFVNNAPVGHYTVIASFLIQKDGTVAEVKALNDPGYGTAEELMRVLKKSPKWVPAMQDGKPVNYRQKQAITFNVESVY